MYLSSQGGAILDTERNIALNIRRLREARGVTQEVMAQALGVTFQAVSKWERGVTLPDTAMLPGIARYLGVTIDALFQEERQAYSNVADRLMAVYEASHDQNDFIRAAAEYQRLMDSGNFTREDARSCGVLYEFHMYYCRDKALELYGRVLSSDVRDETYYRTLTQRIQLLTNIGRAGECLEAERRRVRDEPDVPENYRSLIGACYLTGEYQEGLRVYNEALERFGQPDFGSCVYAGDICKKLGRYKEAFGYWDLALTLSDDHIDPLYSKAFCLHDLGRYDDEAKLWQKIIDWLAERGFVHETAYPRSMLRQALVNAKEV